jgi:hypothetical protein
MTLLLALVCFIAWPGMTAPLLLDDLDQTSFVSNFTSWQDCINCDCYRLFRPTKNLIYYYLGNLSLFKWHALNLSVYLSSVVAVYLLLRRLLGSFVWALAATALWATCPTQVSTAVWMSAVNLSLAITFTCACLSCHDRSREQAGRGLGLAALACLSLFLAQCSYEIAVAVPGLCVLLDALRQRSLFSRAAILRYLALSVVTLGYLAIRAHFGAILSANAVKSDFAPDLTAWQLSLSAPWLLWRHFSMWLMPAGRLEFCGTYLWKISAAPWELAAAWAWLLLLLGLIAASWKRQPWLAFGLLWFLISSFPTSNFIPIWAGPIADYYLVLPGIGLAIALLGVAKALLDWIQRDQLNPESQRQRVGGALLSFIVLWRLLCIPLFWLQADLWNRPLELFLHSELTRSAQYHAQSLISMEFLNNGDLPRAKEWAIKSYATAPWLGAISMILGRVAFENKDFVEAEKRFDEAIRNSSNNVSINEYSQLQLAKTFMTQESKRQLTRETLLPLLNNPQSREHLSAINLQIDCYLAQNKPEDARRAAAKAQQLHPENSHLAARLKEIEQKFPPNEVSPQLQK